MTENNRSYSDPSYGSRKVFNFDRVSAGTRSPGEVTEAGVFTAMHPIALRSWSLTVNASTDGGTSQWVLQNGTTAIGTLTFVTNPTAGTTVEGDLTGTVGTAGSVFYLYSATSVADPAGIVAGQLEYVETFAVGDN